MSLGESMKVASGKIEAVIAGAILVVVVVLFAKYHDRGTNASHPTKTPAAATKRGIE